MRRRLRRTRIALDVDPPDFHAVVLQLPQIEVVHCVNEGVLGGIPVRKPEKLGPANTGFVEDLVALAAGLRIPRGSRVLQVILVGFLTSTVSTVDLVDPVFVETTE